MRLPELARELVALNPDLIVVVRDADLAIWRLVRATGREMAALGRSRRLHNSHVERLPSTPPG